jgi:mannose/fructose/N-acetylgalactosamine-specific phosphotransferase system component IIC
MPAFLAILLGVDAVKVLVEGMPMWLTNWFKVAGGILPALGFAMLYVMMSNKKLIPYFIVGFALAAFFNGSLISVAVIGLAAALLHIGKMSNQVES